MFKKLGYPASIAIGFIALGFTLLGFAWNGAASVDFAQGQIPYLLSGGAVGLGLIVIGSGLLLFEAGRRMTGRLEQRLDRLAEAMQGRAPGEVEPEEAPGARATRGPVLNGQVVIGRSSFHRADCRLVLGKDELEVASLDEAIAMGLGACRVCDPTRELARKK